MTSRDFCYWLQGFFELSLPAPLSKNQLNTIKNHLAMVFVHEIDPAMGPPDHRDKLSQAHAGGQSLDFIRRDCIPTSQLPDVTEDTTIKGVEQTFQDYIKSTYPPVEVPLDMQPWPAPAAECDCHPFLELCDICAPVDEGSDPPGPPAASEIRRFAEILRAGCDPAPITRTTTPESRPPCMGPADIWMNC